MQALRRAAIALSDGCWGCCDEANGGCGRDYILRMTVTVVLESNEGEGTGLVHGGAHFMGSIVKVQLPLGVSNSVV